MELLGLELKSPEWKEPRSGEDLKEVRYSMDFKGSSDAFRRVRK